MYSPAPPYLSLSNGWAGEVTILGSSCYQVQLQNKTKLIEENKLGRDNDHTPLSKSEPAHRSSVEGNLFKSKIETVDLN